MVEEGMIQKIDWSKIPNQKYINEPVQEALWDPNDEYQLPKDWGHDRHHEAQQVRDRARSRRWKEFFEVAPKYSGKIIVVDSMGDVFVAR